MKKYQLLLSLFVASTIVLSSFAQDKKVEFGVAAGWGYTMPRLKDSRTIQIPAIDAMNINGFHAGPLLKLNINEMIGIQTGLLFNHFGGVNIDASQLALKKSSGNWYQSKTTLNTFDLPIRVVYSLTLAEGLNVLLFAGPNLNYAINKVSTTEYYVSNNLNRSDVENNIYESPSNFNALDLQMGVGVGIRYYGASIRAGYDWGLLNRTTYDNATLRSNDIKVTLGYTF
ncbi:MAG: porin family protein [Paludibacteraceae bacterium]